MSIHTPDTPDTPDNTITMASNLEKAKKEVELVLSSEEVIKFETVDEYRSYLISIAKMEVLKRWRIWNPLFLAASGSNHHYLLEESMKKLIDKKILSDSWGDSILNISHYHYDEDLIWAHAFISETEKIWLDSSDRADIKEFSDDTLSLVRKQIKLLHTNKPSLETELSGLIQLANSLKETKEYSRYSFNIELYPQGKDKFSLRIYENSWFGWWCNWFEDYYFEKWELIEIKGSHNVFSIASKETFISDSKPPVHEVKNEMLVDALKRILYP
jgi:hypothetical protein